MPLNRILRETRKELGLTQEQIAEYLGVSTPAVNKWESGATYPDITLLPALARLLKIDLNTLLCFNEGLSEQEMKSFCKELVDTIRKSDFENGFHMAINKIQAYPTCVELIQSVALILEGALMMSGMGADDKKNYNVQIMALYERVVKSDDVKIRNRAVFMLAAKYTSAGEYDKAQEMLDALQVDIGETEKRQLQANLYLKQGKLQEAATILEGKLYTMAINELPILLSSLAEIAVLEGNEQSASRLAEISCEIAALFGMWEYYSYVGPLQVALVQENVQDSISLVRSMLAATLKPWDMKETPLYSHISDKLVHQGAGTLILPGLLSVFDNDPKYAFLNSNEEFRQLIAQYRALSIS